MVSLIALLDSFFFSSNFLSSLISVVAVVVGLALLDLRAGAGAEGTRDFAILRGSSVSRGGLADRWDEYRLAARLWACRQ